MRGHIPAFPITAAPGFAAWSGRAHASSVLCTAKPTSKATVKTV
jgi:hypothetical protein